MTNPWTKKNPFMSLWLSGANRAAGHARNQAKAGAAKQRTALTRQTARAWTDMWFGPSKPKRRR